MINKILKALKAADIYNISPLDYEQEDKIKEVVLSVTGLSENDPDFEPFISKLVDKLGLYDDDPEDNAEVLAWTIALQLNIIKPFKGWVKKSVDYTTIENAADSEYFEDDYPVIKSYFEQHGVTIINKPIYEPEYHDSMENDPEEYAVYQIMCELADMGYSKGDIINSDDYVSILDRLGMDLDDGMDLVDRFEEEYDVSVMSNDMLAGSGPGNYYETDSSTNERMEYENLEDYIGFSDNLPSNNKSLPTIGNIRKEIEKLARRGKINVIAITTGKTHYDKKPVLNLTEYQLISKYYNVPNPNWDYLLENTLEAGGNNWLILDKSVVEDYPEKYILLPKPITFKNYLNKYGSCWHSDKLLMEGPSYNESLDFSENVWNYLVYLGYSDGDIVMSDHYTDGCIKYEEYAEDDFDDCMQEIENNHDVNIFAPEVIEGDGPGEYVYVG